MNYFRPRLLDKTGNYHRGRELGRMRQRVRDIHEREERERSI